MKNLKHHAAFGIALIAVAGSAFLVGYGQGTEAAPPSTVSVQLPACQFEHSRNCYWDPSAHGNEEGAPFVDFEGTAYYPVEATEGAVQPRTP